MHPFEYHRPDTLADLCRLLQQPGAHVLAGGSDVLPQIHAGHIQPGVVIDISALSELRFIRQTDERLEIGALTTFGEMGRSALAQRHAPALVQAAGGLGAVTTRARATLGGNLGNASPAADSIPALFVHAATLHLCSAAGERSLPIEQFLLGPGKTALRPGEYIHHASLQACPPRQGTAFVKHGPRRGMTIAIASAAAAIHLDADGRIAAARLAVGAVAPTVVRCPQAEALLRCQTPTPQLWQTAAQQTAGEIAPIDDVRASRCYRLQITPVLVQRALCAAYELAQESKA